MFLHLDRFSSAETELYVPTPRTPPPYPNNYLPSRNPADFSYFSMRRHSPHQTRQRTNRQDAGLSMASLSLDGSAHSQPNSPPDSGPESSFQPISRDPHAGLLEPCGPQSAQNTSIQDISGTPAGCHLEHSRDRSTFVPPSQSGFENYLHPLGRRGGVRLDQRRGQTHQQSSQAQRDPSDWPPLANAPNNHPTSVGAIYGPSPIIQLSHSTHSDTTDSVSISSPVSLAPSSRDSTVQPEDSLPGPAPRHSVKKTTVPVSSISIGNQHHSQSNEGCQRSSSSPPLAPSPNPSTMGGAFNSSAAIQHYGRHTTEPPHSTSSTKKSSKRHRCTVCEKVFPRPSGLKTHMNMHSNTKPFKCPDPDCDKTFSVRSNAKRHYRIHGGDPNELHPSQLSISAGNELQFSEPQVVNPHPAAGMSNWTRPLRWTNPRTGRQASSRNQVQPEISQSSFRGPGVFPEPNFATGSAIHADSSSQGFYPSRPYLAFDPFDRPPQS